MAGETSYKKKGKLSRQESNKSSKDPEIEVDKFGVGGSNNQNKSRSGSRVYKIVVLGDGGVGKSGMYYLKQPMSKYQTLALDCLQIIVYLDQVSSRVINWI